MVPGRAFPLGRKSSATTAGSWAPNPHHGSASPPGQGMAGVCRDPKPCSAPKTLVTAGCRGGHATCRKPVADLVSILRH